MALQPKNLDAPENAERFVRELEDTLADSHA